MCRGGNKVFVIKCVRHGTVVTCDITLWPCHARCIPATSTSTHAGVYRTTSSQDYTAKCLIVIVVMRIVVIVVQQRELTANVISVIISTDPYIEGKEQEKDERLKTVK